MKKLTFLLIAAVLLMAVPVFAQNGFKDVPDDHWAYDAVSKLQAAGMVQGYPGGLFMGKRTLTRYEFAMVIQNIYDKLKSEIPTVPPQVVQPTVDVSRFITKSDLDNIMKAYGSKFDGFATKADVDAAVAKMSADIKALGAEFRKELDSLGVRVSDLDAKVNDLAATVAMVKAEQDRVKITGTFNTYAKVVNSTSKLGGPLVDTNGRTANANDSMFRSLGVLTDFDLSIKGKVSENTSISALLNMGNYLGYLGQVDSFNGGNIARNATPSYAYGITSARTATTGFFDNVFPYYLNLDTKTNFGDLTIGRFPIQLSRYTLKKVDVDDYTSNAKTDDGNYPIDGFKLKSTYGGVDILGYVGKTDNNQYLANGLSTFFATNGALDAVGTEFGQTNLKITQTAGVNVGVGLPLDGKISLNYTRNWSEAAWVAQTRNQIEVMGADFTMPLPWLEGVSLAASAGVTNILADVADVKKLDWQNGMYDVKLAGPAGPVSLGVGYKRIGENYVAPGDWGKIGRWQNPRMIKGFYGNLGYSILDNVKLSLGGEMYKFIDNQGLLTKDDKTNRFTGGVEWKMSDANALGLDVEWIVYDWTRPAGFGGDKPTEKYITLGWNHKLNDDTALKAGYQLISYDKGFGGTAPVSVPYSSDYSGGLGVVQLGVSF